MWNLLILLQPFLRIYTRVKQITLQTYDTRLYFNITLSIQGILKNHFNDLYNMESSQKNFREVS